MWTRRKRLFGGEAAASTPADVALAVPAVSAPRLVPAQPADTSRPADKSALLTGHLVEFATALATPPALPEPEDLTADDILFLEGLIKRLQSAQLEVAMLPAATLRLTEMLRHGEAPVSKYAELINQDASLSMEVLKVANSAFYGNSARTTSLDEALVRIGQSRLQGILMLTLMKSRVLKAGSMRGHAELLLDVALPLASCASAIARATGGPADLCFMRGMLLHVEHLVILSTIGDTSREHRAIITPSNGALLLAFARSAIEVRSALALGWGLEDILLGREGDGDRLDYAAVRHAVIAQWLRQPLPAIEGLSPDALQRIVEPVAPRVLVAEPEAASSSPDEAAPATPLR